MHCRAARRVSGFTHESLPSPLSNTRIVLILHFSGFFRLLHLAERTVLLQILAGWGGERLSATGFMIPIPLWIKLYLIEKRYLFHLVIFSKRNNVALERCRFDF